MNGNNQGYINPGERRTLHPREGYSPRPPFRPSASKSAASKSPKGHDAVLKAIQEDKRQITVTLLSGFAVVGRLVARDKFTLSVETTQNLEHANAGDIVVIYKHAVEMFRAEPKKDTE